MPRLKRITFRSRPGDDLKQQLLDTLRTWMRQERLTQKEVARRLGIAQSSVCVLERFAAPKLLNLWVKSGGKWELTLGRDSPP